MFTGIVEEKGEVVALERFSGGARLTLRAVIVTGDLSVGESVAVNGCCLTATDVSGIELSFDLLDETLRRTNLGELKPKSLVNLERALPANGRLGGHFVSGHIDCAAPVVAFEKSGADYRLEIELPGEFSRYIIFKGSITVNGVSLTVAELKPASFVIWLIPHTLEVTNLRALKAGDRVNLEFDMLAKYVERIVGK